MVAPIWIKDTGYYDTTNAEQVTIANRVYTGGFFELSGAQSFTFMYEAQVKDDPDIMKTTMSEIDYCGIVNPTYKIIGEINELETGTIARIMRLPETVGYKIISCSNSPWGDNPISQVFFKHRNTDKMGYTPYASTNLNVRIKNIDMKQDSSRDTVKYTIELVETA